SAFPRGVPLPTAGHVAPHMQGGETDEAFDGRTHRPARSREPAHEDGPSRFGASERTHGPPRSVAGLPATPMVEEPAGVRRARHRRCSLRRLRTVDMPGGLRTVLHGSERYLPAQ